tara:strand:+ start:508 stop:681 length:174 start_codon:yes stop_codon:yes gene_type:complete
MNKLLSLVIVIATVGYTIMAIGLFDEKYYAIITILALFAFSCGFLAGMAIFIQQYKG